MSVNVCTRSLVVGALPVMLMLPDDVRRLDVPPMATPAGAPKSPPACPDTEMSLTEVAMLELLMVTGA